MNKRDLLDFAGLSRKEADGIFALARELKRKQRACLAHRLLVGKTLALVFQKPSLRTRVSFEAGMFQLGGCTIFLGPDEINLGVRETPADCARNLSRWVDLIVVRTFAHGTVEEMARHATVPVINGLTDLFHPCQVLADCFTLLEHRGKLDGLKIAFLGDGNNMVHSWIEAAEKYKFSFALACPAGYEPDGEILKRARGRGAKVIVTHDAGEAARGAHVMYTDVWTSMGQEAEADRRRKAFRDYQLNHEILALADPAALVMHCLPAHRGEEITDEVLDGPQSIVLEQAENRMHVQKAIMVWLLREFRRAKTPGSQASSSSRIKRSKGRKG